MLIKKIPLIIIGIVAVIWYFYIDYKEQNRIDKELLENLNLQLTGVIDSVDVFNGYGGFGIIRLKIISSNMDDYDPRPDHAFYYCVIKKGTAEIYAPAFGYGKGDTIRINTKAKVISYKNIENSITINRHKSYYDYIKKYYK